ncbi:MAG: hypothetical protein MZW92_39360 [Comamonadaceae bacterium]|nr:hypothetical protein [Comamonadaceae bacterium]
MRHADHLRGGVHPGAADPVEMGHAALATAPLRHGAPARHIAAAVSVFSLRHAKSSADRHRGGAAGEHPAGDAGQGRVQPARVLCARPQHQPQHRAGGKSAVRRHRTGNRPRPAPHATA